MPEAKIAINNEQRERLKKGRDEFIFDEIPQIPRSFTVIAGREGAGKSHLALTTSTVGPAYVLDTEHRIDKIIHKFPNAKFKIIKCWEDLVIGVKGIILKFPPGTIIIDSGSDIQQFAEYEYLKREGKDSVGMPYNWGVIYGMCDSLIDDIRFSNFNLVVTARVKERYVKEKATGEIVPRIYDRLPYKADVVLQFSEDRRLILRKNGYFKDLNFEVIGDSLPEIHKLLHEQRVDLIKKESSNVKK